MSSADLGAVKITGDRYELQAGPLVVHEHRAPATSLEREAILESLHSERRRLAQAKRLGRASANDLEYLAEFSAYIDHWETAELPAAETSDVWARLEAVASSLLTAQTEIARQLKK